MVIAGSWNPRGCVHACGCRWLSVSECGAYLGTECETETELVAVICPEHEYLVHLVPGLWPSVGV